MPDQKRPFDAVLIRGGRSDEVFDQEAAIETVPEPEPYNVYAESARMTRMALWNIRQTKAVQQAQAFLTYGDLTSAQQTILEAQSCFERRYGATQ